MDSHSGKYRYVTEAHRENQGGHCERSEHGHPGFRGGPQCSIERGVSSGAHFVCFFAVFYVNFWSLFTIFWLLFEFFLRFEVLFGHWVKFSETFWSTVNDARQRLANFGHLSLFFWSFLGNLRSFWACFGCLQRDFGQFFAI